MANGDFDLKEYSDPDRGLKATEEREKKHKRKRGGWFRGDQQITLPKVTEVTGGCSVSGLPEGWSTSGQQPLPPEKASEKKEEIK